MSRSLSFSLSSDPPPFVLWPFFFCVRPVVNYRLDKSKENEKRSNMCI